MNLEAIVKCAKKADACPYNSEATSAYREAVMRLQPDVLLAFVLAYQRYAFCREAGAWESEVVLDTLSPEEFDARVDQAIAARGVPPHTALEALLAQPSRATKSVAKDGFSPESVPGGSK